MDRSELITKVRYLSERATKGPWGMTRCDDGCLMVHTDGDVIALGDLNKAQSSPESCETDVANMSLITLVPDMAAELLRLAEENERLRAALTEIDGCFQAAFAEGWIDALTGEDIGRIRDLWQRRISFAQRDAEAAVCSFPAADATERKNKAPNNEWVIDDDYDGDEMSSGISRGPVG